MKQELFRKVQLQFLSMNVVWVCLLGTKCSRCKNYMCCAKSLCCGVSLCMQQICLMPKKWVINWNIFGLLSYCMSMCNHVGTGGWCTVGMLLYMFATCTYSPRGWVLLWTLNVIKLALLWIVEVPYKVSFWVKGDFPWQESMRCKRWRNILLVCSVCTRTCSRNHSFWVDILKFFTVDLLS